ncbi:MAG: DEAD/DEAH box helicase, partial [Aeromicrobium erythreum]
MPLPSSPSSPSPVHDLLQRHADRVLHVEHLSAREAVVEPWPDWVEPHVRDLFGAEGVQALWGHQAEALGALRSGHDVVVSTGTASGKSLVFQVPALDALARGREGAALHGFRAPTVLYLAPTKALAGDQLRRLEPFGALGRFTTVDGDDSREQRAWAREHADWVLTNPDTLHHSILPGHARWTRLLAGLRYVVVDECHHYRGLFGAHVAHVLRRLLRVCEHYGSD